jgi:cytochrome c heme-lyase
VVTRPALDSIEAALDRLKFNIYTQFAAWGLPCPVTGQAGRFAQQQQQAQQQMQPPQAAGVAS